MTPRPFTELYPGDHVQLPHGDDGWGPPRRILDVRRGTAHTQLPIITVWWQAGYDQPNCAAYTGDTYDRGFLRVTDTEPSTIPVREALQRAADGRVA